jgi:hypothetical protein
VEKPANHLPDTTADKPVDKPVDKPNDKRNKKPVDKPLPKLGAVSLSPGTTTKNINQFKIPEPTERKAQAG